MELLEREGSLQALAGAWQAAAGGDGRVVLVSGEAGLGKTSLVERFTRAQGDAARVLWGACDALFTPRPLGPLHDIAMQTQGQLLTLLNSDANRTSLFSACLAELQRRPTIGVLEDMHWADEATLDLLKFLGRRIARTRALLIVTYRDDELGPQHLLRTVLGDLATSPALHHVALAPLSETAVRALVGRQRIDASQLHRQTGGNPFFVTEVLDGGGSGLPVTIRDAVLARVGRLSASAQAVLQAAAVIGPRIEPWVLTDVTSAEMGASEECLAVGILVAQGLALAFRHELARQVVLETLSPPRKLALHQMTLAALKNSPLTRTDLTRLAHHAEATGDGEAVLEYAPPAARQAATAGAHREAAVLYALALRFADAVPPEGRAAWLEAYAEEMHTIGALEESTAIRQQAVETWRAIGRPHQEGLSLARQAVILLNIGHPVEARRASQMALDLLQALPPSPELALAQRTQAHLLMLNRDCAEAVAWGERSIELADRFNDQETLARAYTTLGAALLFIDYARGRQHLQKCRTLAQAIGWEFGVANAQANLGSISCELYRLSEAEADLRDGLAYTGERDLDFLGKYMLAWQALTFLYLGRWAEARQVVLEALQGSGLTAIGRIPALTALGRLGARQGESGHAAVLDEAQDLAHQSQTLQRVGLVQAARAEAAWLAGDSERTRLEAQATYDLAVSKQHPWFTGELAFWLWRAGERVRLPEWTARPFALHITGEWQAAAAAWQRLGCPYEQARALADGDAAAQTTALEIFNRLGAAPDAEALRGKMQSAGLRVPRGPRPATRENPFGLTPRQVEVLRLLTEGLTNGEIAARLHLSPKTVDHHVSAVFARLDVHSREEAAKLARRQHLFQPITHPN